MTLLTRIQTACLLFSVSKKTIVFRDSLRSPHAPQTENKRGVGWKERVFLHMLFMCLNLPLSAQYKTVVTSSRPANRWEEAMVSGNGATGVMVYGNPLNETIVVNHEKCWVPVSNLAPKVANMQGIIEQTRVKAKQGNFGVNIRIYDAFSNWNIQNFPKESLVASYGNVRSTAGKDKVHPAFYIKWKSDNQDEISQYTRETVLDDAEVNVKWSDNVGAWKRSIFVSRPDSIIVWRMQAPQGGKLNGVISLDEMPGKLPDYTGKEIVDYSNNELYHFTKYGYNLGQAHHEGYHALGKVICKNGESHETDTGLRIEQADEVLVIMRFEYLMDAEKANRNKLKSQLAAIKPNYDHLLKRNATIHSEMLNRVKVDFGAGHGAGKTSEEIIANAIKNGMTAELLELIHDIGRYALICSSGEFPPALMGIWGGSWNPPWTGHYTFDSNIQLAIAAAAIGNLPEASESYFNLLKTMYPAWETNAKELFGHRGYHASIGSSWRKASGLNTGSWFSFTGAAGWLSAYVHEYYLCTGDKTFLKEVEIPLLKNIALFYEDFLEGMENEEGKYLFYPSISPESMPDKLPGTDWTTYITPNATSEIAICSFVLRTLIEYCNELGIEQENINTWETMLSKMPDFYINEDGALHEWSYPGVDASYSNKHCSQFFGLYPAVDVNEFDTPDLNAAIKQGLKLRAKAGVNSNSGHALLHNCFFASRTKDKNYLWETLDIFATHDFFYNSLLTAHFPNQGVYNLDATLCFPAVVMEMLANTRPGTIELLPGVNKERLPKGSIEGMLTRTQVKIEKLTWDYVLGTIKVQLLSKKDQTIELGVPMDIKETNITTGKLKVEESERGNNWKSIELKAYKSITIEIKI